MTAPRNRAKTKPVPLRVQTGAYAVVGRDIGYSLSPKIFGRVFTHLGWPAIYEIVDCSPQELRRFLARLTESEFAGLNVTAPYKTRVIKSVDRLDTAAAAIGAVNTIAVRNGRLHGFNTDADGIAIALSSHKRRLQGGAAIILGAGGAARAVAYSLSRTFAVKNVTFAVRALGKGRHLARDLRGRWKTRCEFDACVLDRLSLESRLAHCDLLVNATPIGGMASRSFSPLPRGTRLLSIPVVFDLVYRPRLTRFMRQAEHAGCRSIVGGWPMLVGQADAAFKHWTGRSFPVSVKRELLHSEGCL